MTRVSIYTIDHHVAIWLDGRYHSYKMRHPNLPEIMIVLVYLFIKLRIRSLYDIVRKSR
jgi:hypothetical protein